MRKLGYLVLAVAALAAPMSFGGCSGGNSTSTPAHNEDAGHDHDGHGHDEGHDHADGHDHDEHAEHDHNE